jgi:hypothetical protein
LAAGLAAAAVAAAVVAAAVVAAALGKVRFISVDFAFFGVC